MQPIDLVLEKLSGYGLSRSGDSGKQWTSRCPCHDDDEPSLAIGIGNNNRVLFCCYANCRPEKIVESLGLQWSDLFEGDPPVTLEQLAYSKQLPIEWLVKNCGLHNMENNGGVGMPYLDEQKVPLFIRRRKALRAKDGTFQPKGKALQAYGQHLLPGVRQGKKSLILVEGESDCWTLWYHGMDAIGVPGAASPKVLHEKILDGIDQVYIWKEPGEAGEEFARKVARKLEQNGYKGNAKIICHEVFKDPSAIHCANKDPQVFKDAMAAVIACAVDAKEYIAGRQEKKLPGMIRDVMSKPIEGESKGIPGPSPGFYALTDLGNAQRLVYLHGTDIRFCKKWDVWLVWNGKIWKEDETGEVIRKAIDTVHAIYREGMECKDTDLRDAVLKHAKNSESAPRIFAMINLAQSIAPIPVNPDELDCDPWLFNVQNATIDLRTGEAKPVDRCNLITKSGRVEFRQEEKCPVWLAFLDRIMGGDAEMIEFLQAAVGYSLTAEVSEKCFFFLYGGGDNGKSTFTEIVIRLLGDYTNKAHVDMILSRSSGSGIPNDIARLVGVRMVSTAELPNGRELDEAKVKDLTGNDTITARFMRAEWFDFKPVFKLWMYGNHKPVIRGTDDGIWRRVRLIPFSVTIPRAQQDPKLPAKLIAELPGILNWAIEGCLKWQQNGLPIPKAIQSATTEYRAEMDSLGEFLEEYCRITNDPSDKVECKTLFTAYVAWSKDRRETADGTRAFNAKMRSRNISLARTNGLRVWRGMQWKSTHSPSVNGTANGVPDFSKKEAFNLDDF